VPAPKPRRLSSISAPRAMISESPSRSTGRRAKMRSPPQRRRWRLNGPLSRGGVLAYLEATGKQAKEQEAAFRACAEAQRPAGHDAIDKLHKSATSFADDRRDEIETAVKHMKVEADAAKTRLDKLHKAGGESWAAMKSALAETRAALDKANQAVHESLKRVA
jgi:hypothetical protein